MTTVYVERLDDGTLWIPFPDELVERLGLKDGDEYPAEILPDGIHIKLRDTAPTLPDESSNLSE